MNTIGSIKVATARFSVRQRLRCTFHTSAIRSSAAKVDYGKYFSKRAKLRQPSAIRALQPLLAVPGMISLGGGMPNRDTFPIRKVTCEMLDGSKVDICTEDSLDEAFQYSPTQGIPLTYTGGD